MYDIMESGSQWHTTPPKVVGNWKINKESERDGIVVQTGICLSRFNISALSTSRSFINAFFVVLLLNPSVQMQCRFCSSVYMAMLATWTVEQNTRCSSYEITVSYESVLDVSWMDFSEVQSLVCLLWTDFGFSKRLTDTGMKCKPKVKNGKFMSRSLQGIIS